MRLSALPEDDRTGAKETASDQKKTKRIETTKRAEINNTKTNIFLIYFSRYLVLFFFCNRFRRQT